MTKYAVVIMENEKDEFGYIPCVVIDGESGYRPLDWNWGNDRAIAEKLATEYNTKLGVTESEKQRMILESMRVQ